MNKSLRLTEKWMHCGLWLFAIVFASFLIGLGGTMVGDLPKVERQLSQGDFMDRAASTALRDSIKNTERAEQNADAALEQARLKRQVARADTAAAGETFDNWLAQRRAAQLSDQDANCWRAPARSMACGTRSARPAWRLKPGSGLRSMSGKARFANAASWPKWSKLRSRR